MQPKSSSFNHRKNIAFGLAAIFSAFCLFSWLLGTKSTCPTKGWVRDECVKFGEFRYGDNMLLIPNIEPNKFRWQGGLSYNKELKALSSPNLGFYWRTGRAAGRASGDWPVAREDLIRFSLWYFVDEPEQTNPLAHYWREVVPRNDKPELPFNIPAGLRLYTENDGNLDFSVKDRLLFLDEGKKIFIYCPSVSSASSNFIKGYTSCHGIFYPQPGLHVSFAITTISLQQWPEAIKALSTLIKSWSSNHDFNRAAQ